MGSNIKKLAKKALVSLGLRHPAKGIKVTQARKAEVLLAYKTPTMDTLVETGTYQGGMIEMLKKHFRELYSVEFDKNLYDAAVRRFQGENNVHLYYGDSAQEIHKILKQVTGPALVWLDAHAAGPINFKNSPIEAELCAVFKHPVKDPIILIDDARHFSRSDIRKIKKIANVNKYHCVIDEGLFRLTPMVQNS